MRILYEKNSIPVVFCFFLAACGFQLRGQATLPFETLYISSPGRAILSVPISGASSRRAPIPVLWITQKMPQATLEIISVANEKQIMSVSGGGRVREFELRYRVSFRLIDAKGVELIPTNEIALRRILPFTDAQVVAKEGEEAMLVREMQSDSAAQILRRLEAVKIAEG